MGRFFTPRRMGRASSVFILIVLFATTLARFATCGASDDVEPQALGLERMDAIVDLSFLAHKYFAESYVDEIDEDESSVSGAAITAFVLKLSQLWDETGSRAYALLRLAQLIDDQDADGQLSMMAQIIRVLAQRGYQRRETSDDMEEGRVVGTSSDDELGLTASLQHAYYKRSDAAMGNELSLEAQMIEQKYRDGHMQAADELVQAWIQRRWVNEEAAEETRLVTSYTDISEAGVRGHHALLSAFIRLGRTHTRLLDFSPEAKAAIVANLIDLPDFRLTPVVMKWLLTVETYREDQLKLLELVEQALEKTGGDRKRNSITDLFMELGRIGFLPEATSKAVSLPETDVVATEEETVAISSPEPKVRIDPPPLASQNDAKTEPADKRQSSPESQSDAHADAAESDATETPKQRHTVPRRISKTATSNSAMGRAMTAGGMIVVSTAVVVAIVYYLVRAGRTAGAADEPPL